LLSDDKHKETFLKYLPNQDEREIVRKKWARMTDPNEMWKFW